VTKRQIGFTYRDWASATDYYNYQNSCPRLAVRITFVCAPSACAPMTRLLPSCSQGARPHCWALDK